MSPSSSWKIHHRTASVTLSGAITSSPAMRCLLSARFENFMPASTRPRRHELRYDALLYLPHVAAGTTRALRMDVTEYVQCAVHGETDDLFGCGDAFRLRLPRGLVQVDVHVADGRL